MKKLAIILIGMICSPLVAATNISCEYQTGAATKKTKISFQLPETIKFGLLVPVSIQPEDGASASMNTVVLKDYPYLVLADVYRIETNNSRIALLKISPDKTSVEMAYVNMGEKQTAKFYQGKCYATGEIK